MSCLRHLQLNPSLLITIIIDNKHFCATKIFTGQHMVILSLNCSLTPA